MKYAANLNCKSLLIASAMLLAMSVHADEHIIPQGANVAPNGDRLDVTSKCLRLNGRALIPLMGEMHYSREPREEWARSLATMKEGGISIVSTYVFWNHHEWKEGEWDFSGNRDLSAFLEEVKKTGLWAVVRIGPWAHGECREGGFPDWLVDKAYEWANGDAKKARQILRSRDARFLGETKKLFERVYAEVAPISEFGEPQYAYWMIKTLAEFCRENAEELAVADPVFVSKSETRRGRFIFHNDYVRRINPAGVLSARVDL